MRLVFRVDARRALADLARMKGAAEALGGTARLLPGDGWPSPEEIALHNERLISEVAAPRPVYEGGGLPAFPGRSPELEWEHWGLRVPLMTGLLPACAPWWEDADVCVADSVLNQLPQESTCP